VVDGLKIVHDFSEMVLVFLVSIGGTSQLNLSGQRANPYMQPVAGQ